MRFFNQTGDTIIEVMISVTILAVVLGVAFASSTESLREGIDASNRNTAIQLAEQQIASVQNLIQTSQAPPAFPASFCMKANVSGAPAVDTTAGDCNQSPFNIADAFSSSTHTFSFTCTWPGSNNVTQTVQLYYHSLNTQGS